MDRVRSSIRRLDDTGIPLLVARLLVGGRFLYLATLKLLDPVEFLKQIHEYGIVPESMPVALNTIAIVLPFLEVVCGLALLAGVARRGSAAVITGMLVAFTPLLLVRGLSILSETGMPFCDIEFDCGCGAGVVFICPKLAENAALLVLAVLALFSRSRRFCLSGWLTKEGGRRGSETVPKATT